MPRRRNSSTRQSLNSRQRNLLNNNSDNSSSDDEDIQDDDDEEDEYNPFQIGNELVKEYEKKNLSDKTLKKYKSGLNMFRRYLLKNNSSAVVNGEIIFEALTEETIVSFLGYASYRDPKNRTGIKSPSVVSGYRSAIKHGFTSRNLPVPATLELKFKKTVKGHSRTHSKEKELGNVKQDEGKSPLPPLGYVNLARFVLRKYDSETPQFVHCYAVFLWNLMCRTTNAASIVYNHISHEGDALKVFIGRHKGDQEGRNGYSRHVYANPATPEVCPILALGLHIFSDRFIRSKENDKDGKSPKLFVGASLEENFSDWLKKVAKNPAKGLTVEELGIPPNDVGSHSFRKGVSTLSMSFPGGPSPAAMHIRAGWKLDGNSSKYVFMGEGSDQFIGRTVSLLNIYDCNEFSTLPPHFHLDEIQISNDNWKTFLHGYDKFGEEFRAALYLIVASLAYHVNWIESNVSTRHPIFSSRIWTSGILIELRQKVHVCTLRCPICKMAATGIPITWAQLPFMREIQNNINDFQIRTNNQLCSIMLETQNAPGKVATTILNQFSVNGAIPITADQVNSMLQMNSNQIVSRIREELVSMVEPNTDLNNNRQGNDNNNNESLYIGPEVADQTLDEVIQSWYKSWNWGGRMHVPINKDFKMPRGNNLMMWNLWLFGDKSRGIRPFRLIKSMFFNIRNERTMFSKGGKVAKTLIDIAIKHNIMPGATVKDIHSINPTDSGTIFQRCFEKLLELLSEGYKKVHPYSVDGETFLLSDRRRIETIQYVSTYNDIRRYIDKMKTSNMNEDNNNNNNNEEEELEMEIEVNL